MESGQIYLLALGDAQSGCSAFIRSCHNDHHIFPAHHLIKKAYQDHIAWVQTDNNTYIKLEAWDATGDCQYQRLISLPFPRFHIHAIFFSVIKPQTFDHAVSKWYQDLKSKKNNCEVVFIGTQIDERTKLTNQKCDKTNFVSNEQAQLVIRNKLSCNYYQCSARTGQGVRQIYEQIVKLVTQKNFIRKHTADQQTNCQCQII